MAYHWIGNRLIELEPEEPAMPDEKYRLPGDALELLRYRVDDLEKRVEALEGDEGVCKYCGLGSGVHHHDCVRPTVSRQEGEFPSYKDLCCGPRAEPTVAGRKSEPSGDTGLNGLEPLPRLHPDFERLSAPLPASPSEGEIDERSKQQALRLIARCHRARNFPANTCPASRHAFMIAERLAKREPYTMLQEEPEHCAISLLATVAALWELRQTPTPSHEGEEDGRRVLVSDRSIGDASSADIPATLTPSKADLVERLRGKASIGLTICLEAADALEASERDCSDWREQAHYWEGSAAALQAEIDELDQAGMSMAAANQDLQNELARQRQEWEDANDALQAEVEGEKAIASGWFKRWKALQLRCQELEKALEKIAAENSWPLSEVARAALKGGGE